MGSLFSEARRAYLGTRRDRQQNTGSSGSALTDLCLSFRIRSQGSTAHPTPRYNSIFLRSASHRTTNITEGGVS